MLESKEQETIRLFLPYFDTRGPTEGRRKPNPNWKRPRRSIALHLFRRPGLTLTLPYLPKLQLAHLLGAGNRAGESPFCIPSNRQQAVRSPKTQELCLLQRIGCKLRNPLHHREYGRLTPRGGTCSRQVGDTSNSPCMFAC